MTTEDPAEAQQDEERPAPLLCPLMSRACDEGCNRVCTDPHPAQPQWGDERGVGDVEPTDHELTTARSWAWTTSQPPASVQELAALIATALAHERERLAYLAARPSADTETLRAELDKRTASLEMSVEISRLRGEERDQLVAASNRVRALTYELDGMGLTVFAGRLRAALDV